MRIFQPTVTGSNTTTGSLHISGPVYFYTLETSSVFHVLTYNTASGQVFFTASDAIGRKPGEPFNSIQFNYSGNFSGSSNLTFVDNVVYLTGSMLVSGAISASFGPNTVGFYGTASWAQSASNALFAQTASFITASNVWGPFGSSSVYSASYASSSTSASFAATASFSFSASFAASASAAPEDTYIQYNKEGLFGAEEYFRYIYTSHSFQQGSGVNTIGLYSHAEGSNTTAVGRFSHAEGNGTTTGTTLGYSASIDSGIVELWDNYGDITGLFNPGDYLFITEPEGGGGTNTNIAIDSVSWNNPNTVITLVDLSFGIPAPAIVGNLSIFPGAWGGDQIGGGNQSHAEGQDSYTLAYATHVEGINNVAAALGAHVEGTENIAIGQNQTIIGTYNALNTGSGAFIIGDGISPNARHNLLFASQSWFEVSASNVFLQGLPYLTSSYVLTYNSASGQVYFASSSTLEVSPFPFTGSAGITGSIVLTGSMFVSGAISASFGPNTVGFYGTASWAESASQALTASYLLNPYPINVTGSSLYSVAPVAGVPNIPIANNSIFFGDSAGSQAYTASDSNFLGNFAGFQATNAAQSNFLGNGAGQFATNAYQSNFLGVIAGYNATNAYQSNFLGGAAGNFATNAFGSNFLGVNAGLTAASASNSNFLGPSAGNSATSASYSNFLGYEAGFSAASASYSTLIGYKAGAGNILGTINSNNIIIGSNITLPPQSQDSINLGGIIFATGSYSTKTGLASPTPVGGKVGINIYPPLYNFHVSGTVAFPNLTTSSQVNVVIIDTASGQLFYTSSTAVGGGGSGTPAPSDTYIQYNENDGFGAEQHFRYIYNSHSLQQGSNGVIIGQYSHAEGYGTQVGWRAITASSIVNGLIEIYDGVDYSSYFGGSGTELILGSTTANRHYTISSKTYIAPTFSIQLTDPSINDASVWKYLIGINDTTEGTASLGVYSHAEGNGTQAIGNYSHVEGQNTQAVGYYSHAEGYDSISIGNHSHAEGTTTKTYGAYSHAEGVSTQAIGEYSHAEGDLTIAGWRAITASSIVNGLIEIYDGVDYSSRFGANGTNLILGTTSTNKIHKFTSKTYSAPTFSLQLYDTSINGAGTYKYLIGIDNITEGYIPLGYKTHAEGYSNFAIGNSAHAEGFLSKAISQYSHTEGQSTQAIGEYSHAEGASTKTYGVNSHAEGNSTQAIGDYSHAEGVTTVSGYKAFTANLIVDGTASFYNDVNNNYTAEFTGTELLIGGTYYTFRSESYSAPTYSLYLDTPVTITSNLHVVPINNPDSDYANQNNLYGDYSHAEGGGNYALGDYSHAEGGQCKAVGIYSHAEGGGNTTVGSYSHAEGRDNKTIGQYSHAEGHSNIAGWRAITASSIVNGLIEIYDGVDYSGYFNTRGPVGPLNVKYEIVLGGNSVNRVYEYISESLIYNAPTFSLQLCDASVNGTLTYKYLAGLYDIHETNSGSVNLGNYSHVAGYDNQTIGNYSHAKGYRTRAVGFDSHAEGDFTISIGEDSHAEGAYSRAIGNYTHAEGYLSYGIGNWSHAEGFYSVSGYKSFQADLIVSGTASFYKDFNNKYADEFIGNEILINGNYYTFITSSYSAPTFSLFLSDPTLTITTAIKYVVPTENPNSAYAVQIVSDAVSGDYSHAEGDTSFALGKWSHAEGQDTRAMGEWSHTEGYKTKAIADYQTVVGQWNDVNATQSAFIVGGGTSDIARKNLLFVGNNIFEASASSIYLKGLTNTSQTNVLTYNSSTGQVFYTASSAIGGGGGGGGDITAVTAGDGLSGGGDTGAVTLTLQSTSSTVGGSGLSYDIDHNFGTRNVHVTVYSSSGTYETVYPDIQRPTINRVTVVFNNTPATDEFTVYISR